MVVGMSATSEVILLVDNSDADRDLAIRELGSHGVDNTIVLATSGVEALDYLFHTGRFAATQHALPMVMLLDLRLPMIDGVDVLQRVRADPFSARLPVVVLSVTDSDVDEMQCLTVGADGMLAKPFSFQRFQWVLHRLDLEEQLRIIPRTRSEDRRMQSL